MRTRRSFRAGHLILAALLGALVTAGAVLLAAWLLLGRWGLSVMEGGALVNTQFVGDFDGDEAADAALDGMVNALGDRWSYYLTAEEYADQTERRSNRFVGIGVTVTPEEAGARILSVEEGGPAQAAGLLPGEVITGADGQPLTGEAAQSAADLIRGEEGTQVTLTVLGTDGTEREVTLTRAVIQQKSVTWEMLDGDVALITVKNFYSGCAQQGREALAAAQDAGARGVVFDLRNDPGGYISELTDLLDAVLPEGPIFRTGGKGGGESVVESDSECVDLPMTVIVNGDSYSAAEFFAAQLQEDGWAVVVGSPTSGKGYSQLTFPLLHGGAVGLSTKTYRTGDGVSLVGTGLSLDVRVDLSEEDAALLSAGSLSHGEDEQLQAALGALGEGR